jgi:hypothetical protein
MQKIQEAKIVFQAYDPTCFEIFNSEESKAKPGTTHNIALEG